MSGNINFTSANTWATDAATPDFDIPSNIPAGEIWMVGVGQAPTALGANDYVAMQLINASHFNNIDSSNEYAVFGNIRNNNQVVIVLNFSSGSETDIGLALGKTSTGKLAVYTTNADLDPTPLTIWRMNLL